MAKGNFTDDFKRDAVRQITERGDVPPIIRTILNWNFPVMIPDREMESSDEGIEAF